MSMANSQAARAEVIFPGMLFKNISLRGPRRTFVLDSVNGSTMNLAQYDLSTSVLISNQAESSATAKTNEISPRLELVNIAGIEQALNKLNRFLNNFNREGHNEEGEKQQKQRLSRVRDSKPNTPSTFLHKHSPLKTTESPTQIDETKRTTSDDSSLHTRPEIAQPGPSDSVDPKNRGSKITRWLQRKALQLVEEKDETKRLALVKTFSINEITRARILKLARQDASKIYNVESAPYPEERHNSASSTLQSEDTGSQLLRTGGNNFLRRSTSGAGLLGREVLDTSSRKDAPKQNHKRVPITVLSKRQATLSASTGKGEQGVTKVTKPRDIVEVGENDLPSINQSRAMFDKDSSSSTSPRANREEPVAVPLEQRNDESVATTVPRIRKQPTRGLYTSDAQMEEAGHSRVTNEIERSRRDLQAATMSEEEVARRFFEWQSQQKDLVSSEPGSQLQEEFSQIGKSTKESFARAKSVQSREETPEVGISAQKSSSRAKPVQLLREEIQKRGTSSSKPPPRAESAKPPQQKHSLSLFDELFPGENKTTEKRERTSEERLFNLPAFNWIPPEETGLSPEQTVKAGRKAWKAMSRGLIPKKNVSSEASPNQAVNYTPHKEHKAESAATIAHKSEPSVLILHACSKNLEESDFFRLGPKGNHIESWTSGITKGNAHSPDMHELLLTKTVIPGRDSQSLLPLNHYYILFNSSFSASAYLSQVIRLHKLAKASKYQSPFSPAWAPRLAPPPGYEDETSEEEIIKKFTLAPGHTRLSIRKVEQPYPLGLSRIVHGRDPLSQVREKTTSPDLVLFHTDSFDISEWDIFQALNSDGKKRNLHWRLAGKKDAIRRLGVSVREGRGADLGSRDDGSGRVKTDLSPKRFTIAFEDRHEARRFVREWHRRAFPSMKRNPSPDDPVVMVNAETLW